MQDELSTLFPKPFVSTQQPSDAHGVQVVRIPQIQKHLPLINLWSKNCAKWIERGSNIGLGQTTLNRYLSELSVVFRNRELHND